MVTSVLHCTGSGDTKQLWFKMVPQTQGELWDFSVSGANTQNCGPCCSNCTWQCMTGPICGPGQIPPPPKSTGSASLATLMPASTGLGKCVGPGQWVVPRQCRSVKLSRTGAVQPGSSASWKQCSSRPFENRSCSAHRLKDTAPKVADTESGVCQAGKLHML
jgi:hypothetical protein